MTTAQKDARIAIMQKTTYQNHIGRSFRQNAKGGFIQIANEYYKVAVIRPARRMTAQGFL